MALDMTHTAVVCVCVCVCVWTAGKCQNCRSPSVAAHKPYKKKPREGQKKGKGKTGRGLKARKTESQMPSRRSKVLTEMVGLLF